MLNEETYNYKLDRYIESFPDATEPEYVLGEIFRNRQLILMYRHKSDYNIQEEAIKKYETKYSKSPNDIDDLDDFIKYVKSNHLNEIKRAERNIKFYQIRLNRLIPFSKQKTEINNSPINNILNWTGTELELVELIKSLLVTKKITGHTEKEVFNKFQEFFGIKDLGKREKLQTIRARTDKKTPFLNLLQYNINNWINNGKSNK